MWRFGWESNFLTNILRFLQGKLNFATFINFDCRQKRAFDVVNIDPRRIRLSNFKDFSLGKLFCGEKKITLMAARLVTAAFSCQHTEAPLDLTFAIGPKEAIDGGVSQAFEIPSTVLRVFRASPKSIHLSLRNRNKKLGKFAVKYVSNLATEICITRTTSLASTTLDYQC